MADSTTNDFDSLNKKELEIIKLRIEVKILQKQAEDTERPGVFTKLNNYVQKNLGQILGILVLLGGFINPVLSYVADGKKDQVKNVNQIMMQVLDSPATAKASTIEKVAVLDPNIAAPLILNELNTDKMNLDLGRLIYERMYELNAGTFKKSLTDKVLFFFVDDNKSLMEDYLADNAETEFTSPVPDDDDAKGKTVAKWNMYLDLIKGLKLNKNKRFTKIINTMWQRCTQDKSCTFYLDHIKTYRDSLEK